MYILALVIAYFLCAFAIYAASDFLAWRTSLYEWNTDWYDKFRQKDKEERANLEAEWTKVRDQVIGEDVHNTDVQKQVMELEENASVRERREYPEPWWLLNLRRRESAWLAWLKRQGRTTEATRLISAWDALYERFEQEKIYETEIRGRSRFRYLILSLMVPVSILRAIFEFLLPIGVGLFTILVLVF